MDYDITLKMLKKNSNIITKYLIKKKDNYINNKFTYGINYKLSDGKFELIDTYLLLLTGIDIKTLPSEPRYRQKQMALAVTASRHGEDIAKAAQDASEKLVSGKQDLVTDMPEVSLADIRFPVKAFYLLSALKLFESSSQSRRSIQGGAVRIDGDKIHDPNSEFSKEELEGKILQIGKKLFRRLVV